MWFVVHAAVGAAIGSVLGQRLWLIVVAAFLSHGVIDLVPHWDYTGGFFSIYVYGILDVMAGLSLLAVLVRRRAIKLPVVLGGLVAALPDVDYVLNDLGVFSSSYYVSHLDFFPHGSATILPGLLSQLVVVVLAVVVVTKRS
ncbi:MAG: hypothetical protein ACE5E0_05660 [Terriglobia bacterium]